MASKLQDDFDDAEAGIEAFAKCMCHGEFVCTRCQAMKALTRCRETATGLLAACQSAEDALARCYNITDWPADGETVQDEALRTVRAAIAKATKGA